MTEASPTLETLLHHQEWVRALARSLVADPARADDVAQQTMLEAITRAPRQVHEPKGWLARVARNAARALARQEQRRTRREQVVATAAKDRTAPDPAMTVQRAAAHKRVVDVLFTVPEPYHTVLLLRYFDDLEAQEIARRLDRPVATVRTQLQRGLERMRQQLDGEFGGDRAAWCTLLVPLWGGKQAAVGVPLLTTIGALLMTKWILAVTAAIAATLLLQHSLAAPDQPMPADSGGAAVIAATSTDDEPEPVPPDATRREAVASASPEPIPAPAADALRGRVVATDGTAMPDLTLAHERPGRPQLRGSWLHVGNTSIDLDQPGLRESLQHPQGQAMFAEDYGPAAADVLALLRGEPLERPLATTDTFGRFAFSSAIDTAQVVVVQPGLMLYGTGYLPGDDELLLVVGPAVAVTGRVHDEQGTPIADAYVSLGYRIDSLPGFAARLRNTSGYRSWNTNSDASGQFDLGTVPAQPMVTINVQQRGYHAAKFVTAELTGPIDCTLRKAPAQRRPRVAGIVRLADGQPAVGARVNFGQDGAVCGDDGRFAFEVTASYQGAPLTAWLPGLQPSIVPDLGRRLQEDARAGEELELRLGTAALRITGVVLDADGKPLPNAYVFAVGSTMIGSSDQVLEQHIGGQDRVYSDAAGRFELRGLSARDYVVRAVEPRQLLVIDSPPVAAGSTGVELRQPDAAFFDRLEGVVVDRFGQPVQGAEVWLSTTLLKGPSMTKTMPRNDGVVTDQAGRFVVERCPRRGVQLAFGGDGMSMTKVEVPTDGQPLRVQVTRRLRFRLQPLGGVHATAFEVYDEHGAGLFTTELRPNVESTHRRVPIRGEPPTFVVDDAAARIVFFDGDRELLAQPLVLRAEDVVEIAY